MTFPRHLVIGGDGFIGSALVRELGRRNVTRAMTTRRAFHTLPCEVKPYDLLTSSPEDLPRADIVYLVAGIPTFMACEGNPFSWRINVDAPLAIVRNMRDAFCVFISSDAVEWCSATAYARQKAHVESAISSRRAAVVRPIRVEPNRVTEFAEYLVNVGLSREPGLYRWGEAPRVSEATDKPAFSIEVMS